MHPNLTLVQVDVELTLPAVVIAYVTKDKKIESVYVLSISDDYYNLLNEQAVHEAILQQYENENENDQINANEDNE